MTRRIRRFPFLVALAISSAAVGASAAAQDQPSTQTGEATTVVLDDSTCPSGNACMWTGGDLFTPPYSGDKRVVGASFSDIGWQSLANARFSAKNRFANKGLWLNNGSIWCVPPGGNTGGFVPGAVSFAVTSGGC
jgi:hypothetical protein